MNNWGGKEDKDKIPDYLRRIDTSLLIFLCLDSFVMEIVDGFPTLTFLLPSRRKIFSRLSEICYSSTRRKNSPRRSFLRFLYLARNVSCVTWDNLKHHLRGHIPRVSVSLSPHSRFSIEIIILFSEIEELIRRPTTGVSSDDSVFSGGISLEAFILSWMDFEKQIFIFILRHFLTT